MRTLVRALHRTRWLTRPHLPPPRAADAPQNGLLTEEADRPVILALTVEAQRLSYSQLAGYSGQEMGGLAHGVGTMVYPDMSRYEGEWREGMWHGASRL